MIPTAARRAAGEPISAPAAHALLREGRGVVEVIEAADYRTKAAREARCRPAPSKSRSESDR